MQRWQFAVQRQLPGKSLLEVSYVGNRGTRLRATQDLDPIPRQYFSTLPMRDQTTINLPNSQVSNPFYPLLPRTNVTSHTVALSQSLKPYPQFTGMTAAMNSGFSWDHALQLRTEKRLSSGLSAQYSFTWSKFMQAISYLNPTDPRPEKVISDLDRPFRHVVAWIYELPFGANKQFRVSGNTMISTAVNGWQVQGVFTYPTGPALAFRNPPPSPPPPTPAFFFPPPH